MNKTINVAIDGPSGAGKSTIAKIVANRLEFLYVDTGAMYRALALACIRKGISPDDEKNIVSTCMNSAVTIQYDNGEQIVLLNDENVNSLIRTEEVSRMTSSISAYPQVREKLLELQRNLASKNNVIMDGRDIGSNVLPNANPKIYLTASVATRAKRRYLEQIDRGIDCTLADIELDIEKRDYRDMNRDCAPLTEVEDSVKVDSSDMNIEEVVEEIIKIIDRCN